MDLVDRRAAALGATATDVLLPTAPPDTLAALREQAKRLFDSLLQTADREMLLMLNPLLARLVEWSARSR